MITAENLYQPDKYKVWVGNGTTAALCTVWNEVEKAIKASPEVLEKSALVGTLYSRQGVNIILRNLALNPQIRTLYMWDHGTLSCSPFGVTGKSILEKIWESGVDDNGYVAEVDFTLEKEIDPKVVNIIKDNVRIVTVSEGDIHAVTAKIENVHEDPYMDPVRFADAEPEVVDIFPSETLGFVVHGSTVVDTWLRVVDRVMRYGVIKGTQYGTQQRELIGVTWVINNEDIENIYLETDWPTSLKQTTGLNLDSIKQYFDVFLSPDTPEGIKYTYGNRLQRYPHEPQPINEIEDIILKELKDSPDTRRAVATTLVPAIDKDSKEPPCITQIQCLQTEGKLHLLVTARSHDIFKAAIPNAFGLLALQKKIANESGFEVGSLQITSQSAHIYESDWDDAKKLAECTFWEREPNLVFDPATSADKRGMFIISVDNDGIIAQFKTPSGDDMIALKGKTAWDISARIAQLELVSRFDHALDIGAELQKAEIALQQNLIYTQDRPLPF